MLMKKLAVILVLVLVASALWAQDYGKYGIGANIGIETDVDSDIADVTTTDNLMTFIPAFSMMLSESMELMPFLIIASDTHSESDNPAADSLDLTLGAGCGLHWYPIRASISVLGPAEQYRFMINSKSTDRMISIIGSLWICLSH